MSNSHKNHNSKSSSNNDNHSQNPSKSRSFSNDRTTSSKSYVKPNTGLPNLHNPNSIISKILTRQKNKQQPTQLESHISSFNNNDDDNNTSSHDNASTYDNTNIYSDDLISGIRSIKFPISDDVIILPQKLLNYYPGPPVPFGIAKVMLDQIHIGGEGVCLHDFAGLVPSDMVPSNAIAEGVILVNLSDMVPKHVLDALLADYTVSKYRNGYLNTVRPFITSFSKLYRDLIIRLYSLRLQNYVITYHLDVANNVNLIFRRNSKFYNGLSTEEINTIIREKLNGFLTELINSVALRFSEYDKYLESTGTKDYLDNIPINNARLFNYIVAIQRDKFHLSDTASLSYILNTIKSYRKYTSPNFAEQIYLIGNKRDPDLHNISSGINSNLLFMMANETVSKTIYPINTPTYNIDTMDGAISYMPLNVSPKFINIGHLVSHFGEYVLNNLLALEYVNYGDDDFNMCVLPGMTSTMNSTNAQIANNTDKIIPMLKELQFNARHNARLLMANMARNRFEIANSYKDMIRLSIDDDSRPKHLIIGVNLDIEFDKYILESLQKTWDNAIVSHASTIDSYMSKRGPVFTNMGMPGSGMSSMFPNLSMIMDMIDNMDNNTSSISPPKHNRINTIDNNTGNDNNLLIFGPNPSPMPIFKSKSTIKNIKNKSNNSGSNGYSDKDLCTVCTMNSPQSTVGNNPPCEINYVHIPYGIKPNQLNNVDCIKQFKFDSVNGHNRINVMRGSALTYDLFKDISTHIINHNKYPSNIQARFFDFQINTRLRLALGYKVYLTLLDKTLSNLGMPSVESSYLYFRFQQWCRWIKSSTNASSQEHNDSDNPSITTDCFSNSNSDGGKANMKCCQCCKCVSQRDIQYYTFGHLPLLSTKLISEINVDDNPSFWTPRF